MNLNSHFRSIILEVPKYLMLHLIEEKLANHSIHDESLSSALAEHLLSGSKGTFEWNDTKYPDVTLSFTKEDLEEFKRRVKYFMKNELPSVAQAGVAAAAKIIMRSLTKDWPEQEIFERHDMQAFHERLALRWKMGLDPLRMLLTCAREVSDMFEKALRRSKARKGIARRKVLLFLHMRACQISMEIITLLQSGLADGALARWRTLYEVGIIATLIDVYGDDIAERYVDHEGVVMKKAMDTELRFHGNESKPLISKRRQNETNANYGAIISRYGPVFGSNYGWAAYHLKCKHPTFRTLEEAATKAPLAPAYKRASFNVHAGIAGLVHSLGNPTEQLVPLAGASNAGIDGPAINTAYTLTQITSLLYGNTVKLEKSVELAVLCLLRDKVEIECTKAARRLEKDERELTRG